jgi:hypothetical protein
VVNERREPVAGASVSALRRDTTPGQRFLVAAGRRGVTDERGRFRIDNLPPGEFFLCADRREARRPAPRASSFQPRVGYVTTCYPGSATLEGAGKVTVRPGEETPGVQLVLRIARLGRVTVTATDSLGRPLLVPQHVLRQNNGGVTLTPRGRDFPWFGESPVTPEAGRFVFTDVPPGDYYAAASLSRFLDSGVVRDGGFTEVTVDGDDVAVGVRMNTGATLAGRVVREGPASPIPAALPAATRSRMRQITVMTLPESGRGKAPSNPGEATVREDGTFEIAGVRGTFFLSVRSATGTLKAIRRAGQDVTDQPISLRGDERIDDVEVVLTTETGRVAGVVMDDSGRPAPAAWVIVFAEDPRRWHLGSAGVARLLAAGPGSLAAALLP